MSTQCVIRQSVQFDSEHIAWKCPAWETHNFKNKKLDSQIIFVYHFELLFHPHDRIDIIIEYTELSCSRIYILNIYIDIHYIYYFGAQHCTA